MPCSSDSIVNFEDVNADWHVRQYVLVFYEVIFIRE